MLAGPHPRSLALRRSKTRYRTPTRLPRWGPRCPRAGRGALILGSVWPQALLLTGAAIHYGSKRSTAIGTRPIPAEICTVSPRTARLTREYECPAGSS